MQRLYNNLFSNITIRAAARCTTLLGCLWLLTITAYGQEECRVKGLVRSQTGLPVTNASVILNYTKGASKAAAFTFTDSTGHFTIACNSGWTDLTLDITAVGFLPQKNITASKNGGLITISMPPAWKPLTEATVVSAIPVKQKGDTTTFNAASFSNKNESTVEALVKKLPGFDVDQDGNMKYNGRPVERVLLDGDDLFGKDFKLLTKNLSADALDKLQVIDNYSTNSALAGLGKTDKQVLNLKLKKNILKTTGSITAGGGLPQRFDGRMNLLTVTRQLKLVTLGALNNTGTDLFSMAEPEKNEQQKPGALPELSYTRNQPLTTATELVYRGIDFRRSNRNNARMASSNFFIRPSAEFSVKGNIFFVNDRIVQEQENLITYFSGSQPRLVSETAVMRKRLQYAAAGLEAEFRPSPAKTLVYKGAIDVNITRHQAILRLQQNSIEPVLHTRQLNTSHHLQYTQRLSTYLAMQYEILYHYGRLPQQLVTNPVIYKDFLGIAPAENGLLVQESLFPIRQLLGAARIIGKKNNTQYMLSLGGLNTDREFSGGLFTRTPGPNPVPLAKRGFNAEYHSHNTRLFADASLTHTAGRFTLSMGSVLYREKFKLPGAGPQDTVFINTAFTYTQQKINLGYKTGNNGRLTLQYAFKNRLPVFADLLPHYWLATYRSFEKGTGRFERVADNSISVNYSFADFYRRQLLFFTGLVYNTNPFAYNRNLLPLDAYEINQRIVLPSRNPGLLIYGRAEKYIHLLRGNMLLDVNSYSSSYLNQVAGLETNTQFRVSTGKFSYKSAWKGWLNLTAGIVARLNNQHISLAGRTNRLRNHIYENRLQLNITPRRSPLNLEISAENYSIPSGGGRSSFLFMDFNFQYTVKKDKLVCSLLGNNLLDVSTLAYENISPLQSSIQRFNLVPRFLMLRLYYKF